MTPIIKLPPFDLGNNDGLSCIISRLIVPEKPHQKIIYESGTKKRLGLVRNDGQNGEFWLMNESCGCTIITKTSKKEKKKIQEILCLMLHVHNYRLALIYGICDMIDCLDENNQK